MQITLPIFFALLAATGSQAINTVAFDCTKIPNVCENMCWGVYCMESQGKLATLQYDGRAKKDKVIRQRRTAAGCGSYNRCSNSAKAKSKWPVAGFNCDEFPFANSKDSDTSDHVNRCVPQKENSSQGSALQKFFAKEFPSTTRSQCTANPANCKYNIAFQYGKVKNSAPSTSFCRVKDDNTQWNTVCKNTAKSFASPLQNSIKHDDRGSDKAGTALANPTKWKRAKDLASAVLERAGTLAPAGWKRITKVSGSGGEDDGADSDHGSDTSKNSKGSGTSGTGSTSSGSTESSSEQGHEYELANGYFIYTAAKLQTGDKVFVTEYNAAACTGGIKTYKEESATVTEEQVYASMDSIDEENEKCWSLLETTVKADVTG